MSTASISLRTFARCSSLRGSLDSAPSANGAVAGSAAALDVASVRAAFPRDRPANVEHAHGQMAGDMINAVVLLLQSIVTLLRAEPLITLGIWPLVRAELEYAGRITWLLEPLTGEDAGRRRVARGMLEHLSAMQRQRFTAGKWNRAQAAKFKKARTEIRGRVTALFDDVHTPLDAPESIAEWKIGGKNMVTLGRGLVGSSNLIWPAVMRSMTCCPIIPTRP